MRSYRAGRSLPCRRCSRERAGSPHFSGRERGRRSGLTTFSARMEIDRVTVGRFWVPPRFPRPDHSAVRDAAASRPSRHAMVVDPHVGQQRTLQATHADERRISGSGADDITTHWDTFAYVLRPTSLMLIELMHTCALAPPCHVRGSVLADLQFSSASHTHRHIAREARRHVRHSTLGTLCACST